MTYVPVLLWVPDTTEGPVTDAVHLKPCDTCSAIIPLEAQDAHNAVEHPPPPEATPH
jgi:hypothetical protein